MVGIVAEICVKKVIKAAELRDMKEGCMAWWHGGVCSKADNAELSCDMCHIMDEAHELRRLFDRRFDNKVDANYFRKLESGLAKLLRKLAENSLLILIIEDAEQIILAVCLDLLRMNLNIHIRGVSWGACGGLDHILNLVRAALGKDIEDGGSFVNAEDCQITIWNDRDVYQPAHLRSHMVHACFDFICGYGANIHTKKGWNGVSLEGIKTTDKEMKKRLRVINFKKKKPMGFEMPYFDDNNGTFDVRNVGWEYYEDDKPLIPAKTVAIKKTFIH